MTQRSAQSSWLLGLGVASLSFSALLMGCGAAVTNGDAVGGSSDGDGPGDASGGSVSGDGRCEYEGHVYEHGATFPSVDGCNQCSCLDGAAACTERACLTTACGARAGNTCTDAQYCDYEPGKLCGQADAQAVCRPRPAACDTVYSPVCGCDRVTYSSACSANAAGQGVLTDGECAP